METSWDGFAMNMTMILMKTEVVVTPTKSQVASNEFALRVHVIIERTPNNRL